MVGEGDDERDGQLTPAVCVQSCKAVMVPERATGKEPAVNGRLDVVFAEQPTTTEEILAALDISAIV